MKDGEKRIWLTGTECELRPVSAAEFIAAKHEAESMEEKYGTDEETKKLLEGACLTARSIFVGGERRFSSGEEVLNELSVHEILFTAAEYSNEEILEITEKYKQNPKPELFERKIQGVKEFFSFKRDPLTGEVWTENEQEQGGGRVFLPTNYYESINLDFDRRGKNRERITVRCISDSIERDSRRYDAGFEQY